MNDDRAMLFLLPVRRRLAVASGMWLCGIYASRVAVLPLAAACVFCALFLLAALYRRRRRESALFCMGVCMFLCGNAAAGSLLAIHDTATPPQTQLTGTVCAIESDWRVMLTDVRAKGCAAPVRNVMVTLMLDEDETRSPVCVGQRVSGVGRLFETEEVRNPGGIDRRISALTKGYELSGYILPGWTAEGKGVFSATEWFRLLRLRIEQAAQQAFGDRAALFQGVLLGSRDGLEDDLVRAMQMTGTVHILTVSGLHMSMLAAAIGMLLRPLPIGKYANLALEAAILLFFLMLTGGAAGTQRAMIMALLRTLARCRGLRYEPLTALSAAALLMTAINPLLALSVSFQFSFFVVFGIQLLGKNVDVWIMRRVSYSGVPQAALRSACMALCAQLSAIPLNLLLYGYVPLLSIPMNMFCSALLPLIMIGGWLAIGLAWMFPFAAQAAAVLPSAAAALFERVSLFAGALDGAILRLPAPYAAGIIPVMLLMMLVSKRIRYGRLAGRAALCAALVAAVLYIPRFDPRDRYVQADVGQGDGAILRSGRRAVLVDAGPSDSYDVLRYLRHEGLVLDAVFLSHLDEDHAGALASLVESEIDIPVVYLGEGAADAEESEEVLSALAAAVENGTQIRTLKTGDTICLPWMTAAVYVPDASHQGSNERSMLLDIQMNGRRILTTGDLPMESEPSLVSDCDVLKVAHHGSRYASSRRFLEMAQPEIAVISVGERNSYGHPTARVLDDLEETGAVVLRTDESGCITLWLEETPIRAETWLRAR